MIASYTSILPITQVRKQNRLYHKLGQLTIFLCFFYRPNKFYEKSRINDGFNTIFL